MVPRPRWRPPRAFAPGLLLLATLPVGCAEELGPEPMETTTVAGRVLLGGRPVGECWIEFLPTDGTVGRLRSAPVDAAGRFTADGVARGAVAIRVVGLTRPDAGLDPIVSAYLARIRDVYLIRRRVEGGPLTIDLAEEAYLWSRRQRY